MGLRLPAAIPLSSTYQTFIRSDYKHISGSLNAGFIAKKMLKNVLLAGVMGQDNWCGWGGQETSSFPQEPFIWQLTFLQRVQECNMSCHTAAQIQTRGKSLTVMDILDTCKYAEF